MTPDVFEYVNTSLTNATQQKFISELAKLTGISVKQLRAGIDKERSEKYSILAFGNTDCPIKEEFYIGNCAKMKWDEFKTLKTFEKSKFYSEKAIMNAVPERQSARFVAATPAFWVQASIHEIMGSNVDGGGIYINYPEFKDEMVIPLELYIKIRYPQST